MNDTTAEAIDTIQWNEEMGMSFQGRMDITRIEIAEGTERIPNGAFKGCANLERITFPESLIVIGREAFMGCARLKIPELPSFLESIGDGAFHGCYGTESYELSENNRNFILHKGSLYTVWWDLISYPAGNRDKSYETPEATGCIRDLAFSGNTYLSNISMGQKVVSITGRAFMGCRRLSGIWVNRYNEKYSTSIYDCLTDYQGTTLIFMPPRPRKMSVSLQGIERLGSRSLAECTNISSLNLHGCIEDVAEDAFGDSCRPKMLAIGKGFDCDLPFTFTDMRDAETIDGFVYRRTKDGSYEPFEELPEEKFRPDYYEEPHLHMMGDDDDDGGYERFRSTNVTGVSFKDIAGLEDAKELMYRQLVLPTKHPELFQRFGLETSTGVLLYGPPGTGKTMLARAVASEIDAKFYSVKSTDIRDCYVGKSEENIRDLFETARCDRKAVIFFDDFDSIGRGRGNGREPWQSDLIDEILVQMQGLERHDGTLLVLAATNRPWEIDSALMRSGRFSTHIHVGLPDTEAREAIVRKNISHVPHAEIDYRAIAERTEGYNGADVEEVCRTAKMRRICLMDSGDEMKEITADDLDYALAKIRSSVSRKDLMDIENYRRGGIPGSEENYVPAGEIPPGYN